MHDPAKVAVHVPLMITFGVCASHSYAQRFTPATSVGFSVYVPGLTNIVSPEEALVSAAPIVVCVPLDNVDETIHFAVVNVLLGRICGIFFPSLG